MYVVIDRRCCSLPAQSPRVALSVSLCGHGCRVVPISDGKGRGCAVLTWKLPDGYSGITEPALTLPPRPSRAARYRGVVVCDEHVELLEEAVAAHHALVAENRESTRQAAVWKRWRRVIQKAILKASVVSKHWSS